jgi:hypothetical protein
MEPQTEIVYVVASAPHKAIAFINGTDAQPNSVFTVRSAAETVARWKSQDYGYDMHVYGARVTVELLED